MKSLTIAAILAAALCGAALSAAAKGDYDSRSEAAFDRGLALVQSNDFRGALRCFRQASQYDPSFAGAFLNIGACHERLGEFPQARPFYEKALKLDPDNGHFAYIYALALLRHGLEEEGLRHLEDAVYAEPSNPDYVYELGAAHLAARRLEQAKACFQAVIGVSTNFGRAYFQLGALAVGEGRTNEALRLLDQVGLDCELAPQAYLLRSRIAFRRGNLPEAESLGRMCLKLSRQYWEGYLNLVRILREEGKYKEACEILERVELAESGGDWGALLGRLYEEWGDERLKAGEERAARTLYRQALRFSPTDKGLLAKVQENQAGQTPPAKDVSSSESSSKQ